MDRDAKDKFRISCDNLFYSVMKPSLCLSTNVVCEFVPVKNEEGVIPNLFIAGECVFSKQIGKVFFFSVFVKLWQWNFSEIILDNFLNIKFLLLLIKCNSVI